MRTYRTNDDFAREFASVANAMNRMFAREFRPYDYTRNGGSAEATTTPVNQPESPAYRLPVDAWSDENAYYVMAYVPGVQPDEVDITFEGDELRIKGAFQHETADVDYAKRELFRGSFERRITFNVPVNADGIEATYEHGVLNLRVPKAEVVKPKQIKVTPRARAIESAATEAPAEANQ